MTFFPEFSSWQLAAAGIIFTWSGFVRSGLGFGGAALGLPFMLQVFDVPIFWMPVVGLHLLFFSGLTLSNRLHNVDWPYLRDSGRLILPAALAGVYGLISLPNEILLFFIYLITFCYALFWALDKAIVSQNRWLDRGLLVLGGYVSGASLTGAPLMIAVFMRNVPLRQLRDTLFVLWFVIVTFKLVTLYLLDVPLNAMAALALLPAGALGHVLGLKAHGFLMQHDAISRRIIGVVLLGVCSVGLFRLV